MSLVLQKLCGDGNGRPRCLRSITGDDRPGRSPTTPHPRLPGTRRFHRNMPRKGSLPQGVVADQALGETVLRLPHLLPPIQLGFPQLPSYLNQNLTAAALCCTSPAVLHLVSQTAESASAPLHPQVASACAGDPSPQIRSPGAVLPSSFLPLW